MKAYAKINLILDVFDKREDGYHNIEFLMTSLDLYDEVVIEKFLKDKIEVIGFPNLSNENNLAYKALKLIKKKYNIDTCYKITINKNIPIGAGMAGGSTDAASVLKGINNLEKLGLNNKQLEELGIILGADVPFCIHSKLALVKGIGEQVEVLNTKIPNSQVLVINSGKELLTKDVYQNYTYTKKNKEDIRNILLKKDYELFYKSLRNDLEDVAKKLDNSIECIFKDVLYICDVQKIMVSGSGPTVLIFDEQNKLRKIKDKLKDKYKYLEIYNMF